MRKIKSEIINNILFLDIETAPNWEKFKDVPDNVKKEWIYKFKYNDKAPIKPDPTVNENYRDPAYMERYIAYFADLWERQAGLYPEFSRIICISVGYINGSTLRMRSFSQSNEGELLDAFLETLSKFQSANRFAKLCGHYAKGFDYGFIGKRILINRRQLPLILDTYGLKPWEMESLIDTHEIWKMGGYGSSGTLSSIAMAFGIPTPKDDIEGADVSKCFHNGEIERIVLYCDKDVITLVNVFKAIRGEELLNDLQIEKV